MSLEGCCDSLGAEITITLHYSRFGNKKLQGKQDTDDGKLTYNIKRFAVTMMVSVILCMHEEAQDCIIHVACIKVFVKQSTDEDNLTNRLHKAFSYPQEGFCDGLHA